jgi:hypothetical protein
MVEFEQARQQAIDELSATNTVEKVNREVKNKSGVVKTVEVWTVEVEIPVGEKIKIFNLEVELKSDFPLSLPEIKLAKDDYELVKYIPHVDSGCNICLFDQENIKLDPDQPAGILKVCINRAVKIISDGLNKSHSQEFKDELHAYWADTYNDKDVVVGGYFGEGMDRISPGRIEWNYLAQPYNNISVLVAPEHPGSESVIDLFKLRGHRLEKREAFYLGELEKLEPPFYVDNKGLLSFVKNYFSAVYQAFKSYVNQTIGDRLLLFSVPFDTGNLFFGFYIYGFKTDNKGWRKQSQSGIQIMSTIQPNQPVTRVLLKEFTAERLRKRTDGIEKPVRSYKFMVAGLGSIGSNLIHYLSALEVSNYMLVDPEVVQLENINRHLLSYNDVGRTKVDAIARYLIFHNPFVSIKNSPFSVVDVLRNHLAEVNEMDVIFCAIGKDAIENYVLECLSSQTITRPVVLLWVEPFLLGAHALYINPGTSFSLKDLEADNFYIYNVIHKDSYDDPANQLKLREAGCQGSYMPYGKEAITCFFSGLMPEIYKLIKTPSASNLAFTFTGELHTATSLGVKISAFASPLGEHQLIKTNI